MAHQIYHSISSAKTFGGKPSDYWELHSFFDQSKALLATPQHRMFLHNVWGIHLAQMRFGTTYKGLASTLVLAEQHVYEDLGFVPPLQKCLENAKPLLRKLPTYPLPVKDYIAKLRIVEPTEENIAQVGKLLRYMDSPFAFWMDLRAGNITHNSWSCFLMEELMGVTITDKQLPTRYLVERIIINEIGHIPSAQEALEGVPMEMWQCANAKRLSEKYAKESVA